MVDINLLPWRAIAHENRLKLRKLILVNLMLGSLGLLVLLHCVLSYRISKEEKQISLLKTRSEQIAKQSYSVKILLRNLHGLRSSIHFLQHIEKMNGDIIDFFSHLSTSTAHDVYLNDVICQRGKITLLGSSQSAQAITNFLKRIKSNQKCQNTHLIEIKKSTVPDLKFQFQIHLDN